MRQREGFGSRPAASRWVAALLSAALGLLAAPSVASAVTIKYVNKEVTLSAGVSRVITAKCPPGTHVVGGGGHAQFAAPLSLYSSSTFPLRRSRLECKAR